MGKVIGIIGGSGLYEMEGLEGVEEVRISTPFGEPSDAFIKGRFGENTLVFLPRHGRGHRISPSEINFRANIYGMKLLGVEWIISVSAVGSMKEEIRPGEIVVPDQFFDRTKGRPSTFFGNGVVAHVGLADPVCPELSRVLFETGKDLGIPIHRGGTYICIEGPQFSTRAESMIYRKWGVDVIGMTNLPEARLAREAEICYATLALATDYDCWHETEEDVTVEAILETLNRNVSNAKAIIKGAVERIGEERKCLCSTALRDAIVTSKDLIPEETKKILEPILGKYMA